MKSVDDLEKMAAVENDCPRPGSLTKEQLFTLLVGCYGLGGEADGYVIKRRSEKDDFDTTDGYLIYWAPNGRGKFYYRNMRPDDLYLIGLAIAPVSRRKGLGTFCAGWLKNLLSDLRFLNRIVADVRSDNAAGRSFLEKNGFRLEEILRDSTESRVIARAKSRYPSEDGIGTKPEVISSVGEIDIHRYIYQNQIPISGSPCRVSSQVFLGGQSYERKMAGAHLISA